MFRVRGRITRSCVTDNEQPHLAERTHDIYQVALRCHLIPALGSWLLCDIDGDAIKAYQGSQTYFASIVERVAQSDKIVTH